MEKDGKESLMAKKMMTRKGQQGKIAEEVFALIYEGKESKERTARLGARTAIIARKIFLYW